MLTYKNIQDRVLRLLDLYGDTEHGLDLVKEAIQSAHAKVLAQERWNFMLWPEPISLTFTQDEQTFILHSEVMQLADFWNTTANKPMAETPSRSRFNVGVQEDRFHFEFVNFSPVKLQPTVSGVVSVTGNARLRYMNTNGDMIEEDKSGANTSASVDQIINVTKLNDSALTLTDADGVTLLSLSASEYGKNYPQIRLFDAGRGETGTYRFYRKPSILAHDNGLPDIPYPYSTRLIFDALLELYTYNDQTAPRYWVEQQALWDANMREAYHEGSMEGSEIRTVREVDIYGG